MVTPGSPSDPMHFRIVDRSNRIGAATRGLHFHGNEPSGGLVHDVNLIAVDKRVAVDNPQTATLKEACGNILTKGAETA